MLNYNGVHGRGGHLSRTNNAACMAAGQNGRIHKKYFYEVILDR
jgi:hypothetical protein